MLHGSIPAVVALATLLAHVAPRAAAPRQAVFGLHGVRLEAPVTGQLPPCELPDPPTDGTYQNDPWPSGVVPYQFDGNVDAARRALALGAMELIEQVARVSFVPRSGQSAYVHIEGGAGNFSTSIGHTGAAVTVQVHDWIQAVVVHELMHVLGFEHEQKRPDRDAHVTIVWGNIQNGLASQFTVAPTARTAGPYDYESIMHYSRCAFSVCCPFACCASGCETILAPGYEDVIGRGDRLSALDTHGLRSLYPQSGWRFVDPANPSAGNGTGTNPWRQLSSAVASAPLGSTVFVMPGTYSLAGTWSRGMVVAAPVGGVVVR